MSDIDWDFKGDLQDKNYRHGVEIEGIFYEGIKYQRSFLIHNGVAIRHRSLAHTRFYLAKPCKKSIKKILGKVCPTISWYL